jgi:hypothetical protein
MRMTKVEIRARLLHDPSLWCWDLVEPASGAVMESSWSRDWEAYRSRDDALRAGRKVLGRANALAGVAEPRLSRPDLRQQPRQ